MDYLNYWNTGDKTNPNPNDFCSCVKQKRRKARPQRKGPALRVLRKQKKLWLMRFGVGLESHREFPSEHLHNSSDNRWSLLVCLFPQRFSDSSYSLLADDVLGSYLLCPHPKKPKCGSLIIRFPSGLMTHLIENSPTGKFLLEVTGSSRHEGTYSS